MSFNNIYSTNLQPIDAKIFYENGTPYLEYRGMTTDWNGDQIEVYLPKVSLTVSRIEYSEESVKGIYDRFIELNVEFSSKDYRRPEEAMMVKTIEKAMTKAQIEKELGYKIKIVD